GRTQRGDAVALDLRRAARHENGGGGIEMLRRVRDAESMVARGAGDDAARPDVRCERREYVERTAQLERAGGLRVLELEIDVAAGDVAQRRASKERRPFDERPNAVACGDDIGRAKIGEHASKLVTGDVRRATCDVRRAACDVRRAANGERRT